MFEFSEKRKKVALLPNRKTHYLPILWADETEVGEEKGSFFAQTGQSISENRQKRDNIRQENVSVCIIILPDHCNRNNYI